MLLTWLRKYADTIDVATIMAMADDGGSTGRMRKAFDMPAFGGDFRDALVGLAENPELAKIFTHRFEKGEGLKGHSVWNLILLWLFEATDWNIPEALNIAHKILKVRGKVYPSTTESIKLQCTYDDGTIIDSQTRIDNSRDMWWHHIIDTKLIPSPKAYQKAIDLIIQADKIVMWPWDFYANTVANILVEGISEALQQSKAQKIFIINLMTKYNQTHGFTTTQFIEEFKKYSWSYPDYVIINNDLNPQGINIDQYASEHREMVKDNTTDASPYIVIKDKVRLEGTEFKRVSSDVVPRSFIRHDPAKLAEIIVEI